MHPKNNFRMHTLLYIIIAKHLLVLQLQEELNDFNSRKRFKKVYGNDVVALSDINFEVKPGEKVMLLGHNGREINSFKCLTGFERPTEGKVFIGDTDITSLKEWI